MFKYSFLVFHADYVRFLEHLKDLGVAHIVEVQEELTAEMLDIYRTISELSKTQKALDARRKGGSVPDKPLTETSGENLARRIRAIDGELEQLHHRLASLAKDEKSVEPWGNFSLPSIERLEEAGVDLRFLVCPIRKYEAEWEEKYPISVISDLAGYRYFILVTRGEETDLLSEMPMVDEVSPPASELAQLREEIGHCNSEIEALEQELNLIAFKGTEALQAYKASVEDRLADKNVVHQTREAVEGTVRLVEAWVPQIKTQALEEWTGSRNIYYLKSEATGDDKPPILLKNNRYARLFEPVGKLFSLPAYVELDLTPFFAPFFMMFFGFCLGDAGYGLLFVIGAGIYKYKAKPEMKPVMSLIQWLGLATVIFGVLTGTFFGVQLAKTPIPFLSGVREMFLDNDQMFNLALIFGGIQILFGMILKGVSQIKRLGFAHSLSTWGWFLLIVSTGVFYLLDKSNPEAGYFGGILHMVFLGLSVLGIFIFNHPKRNVFINVGLGLWDTYNTVTGVIGDLLSYIRLFALGLSSAILGLVFNQLAFDMSPDLPVVRHIVILIILLIGHGINIFMSGLGSFVHPLRLTFVEFYKNAGFIGGGKEYKPFQRLQ
jgi:V/A-type H+-transporting ATPase subunit I